MKFTLAWLQDHLETSLSPQALADRLTLLGFEVESMATPGAALGAIRVAKILSADPHPQADRLRVCQVDAGEATPITVVCGAPNAVAGLVTAFIAPGVMVPATGVALQTAVIRGQESHGMMASAEELGLPALGLPGLGSHADGIIDLAGFDATPGQTLTAALGLDDTVIEIAVTPNRGDALSVRGIARDLAAAGCGALKPLAPLSLQETDIPTLDVSIEAISTAVPYFSGRMIQGLQNAPSPAWMQNRLRLIGCNPISLAVDVANYVMFDLGQPLHAYDAATISGPITVRLAKGETFQALNGQDYSLHADQIVIADRDKILALGGIIGGLQSASQSTTQSVFLEAALFDPISIALAGRATGILSDARYRFERKIDPDRLRYARDYAAQLLQRYGGGRISRVVETGTTTTAPRAMTLTHPQIMQRLGIDIPNASDILQALGCQIEIAATAANNPYVHTVETWNVTPPSWRHDLVIPEDLIEELLRIAGYDKLPAVPLSRPSRGLAYKSAEMRVRETLASRGLNEALTWSFISAQQAGLFGTHATQAQQDALTLINPISQDLAILRPSLLPQLLAASVRNHHRGQKSVALFEIGNVHSDTTLQGQKKCVAWVRSGLAETAHWASKARPYDVYDIKADVEALAQACGLDIDELTYTTPHLPGFHPGRSVQVTTQGGATWGYFGAIHPRLANELDLKDCPCFMAEFDVSFLPTQERPRAKSTLTLSPYPHVERDFAFVVPSSMPAGQIIEHVKAADARISSIELFDVYQGVGIPEGSKSLAIRAVLVSPDKTFSDVDLQEVSSKVIHAMATHCQGVLRGV